MRRPIERQIYRPAQAEPHPLSPAEKSHRDALAQRIFTEAMRERLPHPASGPSGISISQLLAKTAEYAHDAATAFIMIRREYQ